MFWQSLALKIRHRLTKGKIMKALMPKVKGKADGKVVKTTGTGWNSVQIMT
ncbi:MAG: hypothetical protein ACLT76_01195 [Clostridium fessum]